jgi:hypothetical protein
MKFNYDDPKDNLDEPTHRTKSRNCGCPGRTVGPCPGPAVCPYNTGVDDPDPGDVLGEEERRRLQDGEDGEEV